MLRSCDKSEWRQQRRNKEKLVETTLVHAGAARNIKDVAYHKTVNTNEKPTPLTMPSVEIYTDGACEPNPGAGGYPNCQATYTVEAAIRLVEQSPSLF